MYLTSTSRYEESIWKHELNYNVSYIINVLLKNYVFTISALLKGCIADMFENCPNIDINQSKS